MSTITNYSHSAGRATKAAAGSGGTFDPTEYYYDEATRLLTKVSYTAGANTVYPNYYYDADQRLTKLTDWTANGSNLLVPENGPLTSGGKVQFVLKLPTWPGPSVPTPTCE